METVIICILAGIGAGLGTGFAGMSAAAVIAPMLIVFLGVNTFEAIGIALASDVLASAVSAIMYAKNKNIDVRHSLWLFGSVLVFTIIGACVSHLAGESAVGSTSLYVALFMGINFLVKSFRKEKEEKLLAVEGTKRIVLSILCGAFIGFICGFVGAGGGIMMLLLLTTVLGYELKHAVGTSVLIMSFTALFGAVSHFTLLGSFPDWTMLGVCVATTLVFALIGSGIANRSTPRVLNRATGIVLTVLGISLIIVNSLNG